MTSPATSHTELEIFNRLSRTLRDAMNECEREPSKAFSVVLAALLRGVSEEKIIETIKRSPK